MRMLHLGYFDCAGAGTHMSEAVNEHTQHVSLTAFLREGVIAREPAVRPLSFDDDLLRQAVRDADVVFLHVGVNEAWKPGFPPRDLWDEPALEGLLAPDKCVMWLNGSVALREHADGYRQRFAGHRMLATNADVAELYGAQWMPCAIAPVLDMGALRWEIPQGPVRYLAHCPTDLILKNVPEVTRALSGRTDWHYKLIQCRPHMESIVERMRAHVLLDHFRGYFGVCAIEGAALGMPVIVNLGRESVAALEAFGCGQPPWLQAADAGDLLRLLDRLPDTGLVLTGQDSRRWYEAGFTNRHKAMALCRWLEAA